MDPPGAKVTMMRIGRDGQSGAIAGWDSTTLGLPRLAVPASDSIVWRRVSFILLSFPHRTFSMLTGLGLR